jgi:hypothetical protein
MLTLAPFAEKEIYAQIYYPSGTFRIVPRKEKRKMKVSGTVDDDLYKWMKKKIDEGTFYNSSHAIQRGLNKLKEEVDNSQ